MTRFVYMDGSFVIAVHTAPNDFAYTTELNCLVITDVKSLITDPDTGVTEYRPLDFVADIKATGSHVASMCRDILAGHDAAKIALYPVQASMGRSGKVPPEHTASVGMMAASRGITVAELLDLWKYKSEQWEFMGLQINALEDTLRRRADAAETSSELYQVLGATQAVHRVLRDNPGSDGVVEAMTLAATTLGGE